MPELADAAPESADAPRSRRRGTCDDARRGGTMTAAATLADTHPVGSPLDPTAKADLLDRFHRDGFALLPGVLAEQAPQLRDLVDRAFAEHAVGGSTNRYDDIVMARMFELDESFQRLLTAEPFISLAEEVLGANCHLVAQNCVRNPPGRAIDVFHADEEVFCTLPSELPRFDARMRMPVFVFTFQILLSDVPTVEHGPTQFVPGSHYAGRQPDDLRDPSFEGRRSVSMLGRAGDVYLHNGQCWHRGAPNTSDRTRYLLQIAYGRRWVANRFHPFIDYRLPDHVRARADERCLRVLGKHPKGPYG
jgi:ectoine hydroxylase-related dioxygenase (phytanoyl-CoA dioxygenase family)